MSSEAEKDQIVAELTVGTNSETVTISDLSMTSCIARMAFSKRPYQRVVLRFFEDKGDGELSPFKSIKAIVESSSQKTSDPNAFYAKIKFHNMVKANQGVVQLLNSKKYVVEEKNKVFVPIRKNSLRLILVSCHMCAQEHIHFRVLQSRSMITKTNIFGVPFYEEAMPRKDFCDYNLIRIIVCPRCYFASNDVHDFQKEPYDNFSEPPFKKEAISKRWKKSISDRKKLVESQLDGFFDEERSVEQALLSYDLGIITCDEIFKADEAKDPKRRNYNPVRKSVFNLMVKAEIVMANNQAQESEKILKEAIVRLEGIYPFLRHEPSIRAGFLLGMLNLYFEEYRKVGQYLSFLRGYNQDGNIEPGSSEYKTLMTNTKKLDEAFQNREEYSKANLKRFQKPF